MDAKETRNFLSSTAEADGSPLMAELRHQSLAQLQGALLLIRDDEKIDLVEALTQVPGLVETESSPFKFLRRHGFEANVAARSLVTYWRYRREIFGERAFLPMTLAGNGAMSDADISAFCKGYLIPLPRDVNGRSVVFTDKARLRSILPVTRRRCFFYSLHVAAENEKSITEGFVAVSILEEMAFGGNSKAFAAFLADGLPITLHSNHIFCAVNEKSPNAFFAKYAAHMVSFLGLDGFQKTVLHATSLRDERKAIMLSLGFREDSIPPSLGGSFDMQKYLGYTQATSVHEDSKLPAADTISREQIWQLRSNPASDVRLPYALQCTQESTLEALRRMQLLQGITAHGLSTSGLDEPRSFAIERNLQASGFLPGLQSANDALLLPGPSLLSNDRVTGQRNTRPSSTMTICIVAGVSIVLPLYKKVTHCDKLLVWRWKKPCLCCQPATKQCTWKHFIALLVSWNRKRTRCVLFASNTTTRGQQLGDW